ncbi:MAG: VCBS repeat-containing protein [Bryobacterales bacterium]
MADLDGDDIPDVISAQEESGHVRIAYGEKIEDDWFRLSLAEGDEAAGARDVSLGDANGDGRLDAIVACEGGHLLYLQNPNSPHRGMRWGRVAPEVTRGRGAWAKAYFADLDGDGRVEVVAANKGAAGSGSDGPPRPISWFSIDGDPLDSSSWTEHELATVQTPVNAQPFDLDGDGDLDIFAGSRGETRVFWFENVTEKGGEIAFVEHPIALESSSGEPRGATAEHVELVDLNADGRIDVLLATGGRLVWAEQPPQAEGVWTVHEIGSFGPDEMDGFVAADIDGDGNLDVMAGSDSLGPHDADSAEATAEDALGRIAWFQNPGDAAGEWTRHDIVRRKRGMFDAFAARDMDGDGDLDFLATRGASGRFDGVFLLEQRSSKAPARRFVPAREVESARMPLPSAQAESVTASARIE